VGVVCLVLCAAGLAIRPDPFFRAYLVAYCYWLGISLGSLAILMVQHLTGGGWGMLIRRVLESATRCLPLLVILFLPIVAGIDTLYPWTRSAAAADPVLVHKRVFLSTPSFVGFSAVAFAVWLALAYGLTYWSRRQDETSDPRLAARMRSLSGPGLVLWGLSVTLSAILWVMSLEPHWYSTIFAVVFGIAQALSALALAIVALWLVSSQPPLAALLSTARLRDLGNLLLTLVMLWAYTAFSQFLLIWAGNLKEEIVWYLPRMAHGWQWIAGFLVACQFGLPFALLLFRKVKDQLRHLAVVGMLILVTCFVNLFWQIVPSSPPDGLAAHWLDLLAALLGMAGIGGTWGGVFLGQLKRRPLVPLHDPALGEMTAHG
jgi:hypothetical protein